MGKVICETCQIEIEVPDGYSAPFLRCPDCGTMQKYNRNKAGEPKFRILDEKGRERAANKVIGKEYIEPEVEKKVVLIQKKEKNSIVSSENKSSNNILDQKSLLIDSVGEEGLNKAYILASTYMGSSSESRRKNGRAKAIQCLMKDKYPLELASKAISYAEKAPETQSLIKSRKIKTVVIVFVVIVLILLSLVFLI